MDTIRDDNTAKACASAPALQADLFGSSTRPAQIVDLQFANGRLVIRGQQFVEHIPARLVHWPTVAEGGTCLIELPDGTLLHCRADPRLEAWSHAARTPVNTPKRRLQHAALALLTAVLVWTGLPTAAESLLSQVPGQIDRHVGQRLLDRLDAQWLQPSELPAQDQQHWRQRLTDAVTQVCPTARLPDWNLQFRHGRAEDAGTSAFGLPGGTVVLLDEQLGRGTLNALCNELGQLQQRQGMRMLARHQPVSLLMGVAFDDFSSTVATAWPVLAEHLPLGMAGGTSVPLGPHRLARR